MSENPLRKLQTFGQSVWLDYIRRQMITSGELKHFIDEDGVLGVTSNPSIFDKVISGSHDYDDAIRTLSHQGKGLQEIYQALTVEDVQKAADLFRPLYDTLKGRDGFLSLEVNPHLAHDSQDTIEEARQLWEALNRPNVFVKVPATREGLPAIRQLISEGINVNVTLLFGIARYREVAEAYIAGMEERAGKGMPLEGVASVASFFLSRIDVLADSLLEKILAAGGPRAEEAKGLRGEVAIASARVAYAMYKKIFASERFASLAAKGARTQRLLWASTSTKNPKYSDVKYVEPLIGPETINTMPLETLNAYRDHGNPSPRLEEHAEEATRMLERLSRLGIDLDKVAQQLEDEGVEKFVKPYDSLMCNLEGKSRSALREQLDRQTCFLGEYEKAVRKRIGRLEQGQFAARLWRKDPSLWKRNPKDQEEIRNALGWLHVAEKMGENLRDLSAFVQEVRAAGLRHVVLMGMGGSSLAPLAMHRIFGQAKDSLPFIVLDTTDPAAIWEIKRQVPLTETLFLIASKSGTTTEPLAFGEYFYGKVKRIKRDRAGENFAAITDPGTPLVKMAQERGFRHTFLNFPDIGGRYSALSYFGLVPAALMGIDLAELLARALRMAHSTSFCVPAKENSGLALGATLGELACQGRDKVTFLVPEFLVTLGTWLEQLLAESTGKEGTGILPVAGEPVGHPSLYGKDRLFVAISLKDEPDETLEKGVASLREFGHPVITIQMEDRLDLAQEFFRWEMATAAAGAVLGINPFDQPNVQESKENTNRLLEVVRREGRLPKEKPTLTEGSIGLYVKDTAATVRETLRCFLSQARPGDYIALLVYLTEEAGIERELQGIRFCLRDRLHLATTLGYGPRYLHSTGQFHKGGPNTGLFLLLTADDADDLQIPGKPYTFSLLKHAQAQGDLEALQRHGRRVIRMHLGSEVSQGLAKLREMLESLPAGSES
jgi:transaldolase/glucose-6-phosphate isomerase